MVAESLMLIGYIPIVCRPPFGVIVVSFLFLGLGMALNLALNNAFCANLANSTPILGAFHGSYGIGGTIGPLIATRMASRGIPWSNFYFLSIGITVFNLLFAAWSFWNYEKDAPAQLLAHPERTAGRRAAAEAEAPSNLQLLKSSARNKTTLLGALFIFAYQGAEVSISGWVISFLIAYRGGDPAQVGYVTAGFWAGITLGRFCLAYPAHKIGERLSVTVLVLGAIVFEILVWFVPNIVSNAVSVSLVGLLLGPIYPCGTVVFSRLLPRSLQIPSLSLISAFGSSGGAIAPFMTGILAQAVGTFVLHPICIALFVVMLACWLTMPKITKSGV
jgi:fucose permease